LVQPSTSSQKFLIYFSKAPLDFLYFQPKAQEEDDFESFRFNLHQMRSDIQAAQLEAYSALFSSPSLIKRLSTIN
jgi:hypothetical protein